MTGFRAFLTHLFFSLPHAGRRKRFLILQLFLILVVIIQIIYISRHTVVCRAAQEAGA